MTRGTFPVPMCLHLCYEKNTSSQQLASDHPPHSPRRGRDFGRCAAGADRAVSTAGARYHRSGRGGADDLARRQRADLGSEVRGRLRGGGGDPRARTGGRRCRRVDPRAGRGDQAADGAARLRDRGALPQGAAVARGCGVAGRPRALLRQLSRDLRPGLLVGDPPTRAGRDLGRA